MANEDIERECEERNAQSDAYIEAHYGDSIGPRRRSHWEVQGGELCLVEE